jgi:hypothetical protein
VSGEQQAAERPDEEQPLVRIESVVSDFNPKRISAFELELPRDGQTESAYAFPIEGRVIGREETVQAVELHDTSGVHLSMPVYGSPLAAPGETPSDFAGLAGAVELPRRFELSVSAPLARGRRARLAVIAGERRRLAAQRQARFLPLLITTIGRSGSTWLSWLLGCHPEILAYRAQWSEARVATYFFSVAATLARPASHYTALNDYRFVGNEVLGLEAPDPWSWTVADAELRAWLGSEFVETLLRFMVDQVDAFCARMSKLESKSPRYFAEKCVPGAHQQMLLEIYPEAREIFVIRDLRDIVCSAGSYAGSYGQPWYVGSGASSEEDWVRNILPRLASLFLDAWNERAESAILVRYEDLVTRTRESLEPVLAYVGVDSSARAIDALLDAATASDPGRERAHMTSRSAIDSVGRWRRELSPALRRACDEALGEPLAALGY